MKLKIGIVIVIIILVVLVLASFSSFKQLKIVELGDLTYEELCKTNRDMWMEMEPWRNGKKISDERCFGCMVGENHFCNVEEYIEYVKILSNSKDEIQNDMGHMMSDAMTAHAGDNSFVDVMIYRVDFENEKINENSYNLIFKIKDSMTREAVSNLEIVHDKIMHVIVVRNDLEYFDHIHPEEKEKGVYVVPYTFYVPGNYRIWADFTKDGMQHIVDFDTSIVGATQTNEPDRLHGLNVVMNLQKAGVGETSKIEFLVTDSNNKAVPIIEKFLAANAHLIILDEKLDNFGHAHDEEFDRDNILLFDYKFKNSGVHKLWVQFSVNGNTITKEFGVEV